MSRRKVLITGAGTVAAGSVAVAGARLTGGGASARPPATNPDLPVMVRLADARKGAFDVFVGTDVVRVVDDGFAARVVSAVRGAGR
jgi:hypothetical protein